MRHDPLLHPDFADPARRLLAHGRLLAEREPELYRAAVRGRGELAAFFAAEFGWGFDVVEPGDMVRLHKRRADVPGQRGPRLHRAGREQAPVPRLVLIMTALVCEQLWRRPRMTLNDLLQAVAQVCATDSEQGLLPAFVVVPGDVASKRAALGNRQALVDALRLLENEGTLVVEGDLERAAQDGAVDGIVAASRDRLATKFSSLSPSLLRLAELPPHRHADALTADHVAADPDLESDEGEEADSDLAASEERGGRRDTTRRRHRAMRRLADDPGTDPRTDEYLQSSTGRNRALNVLHALGFTATVRRDWWQVSDPSGLGSTLDFPHGRRSERQAALALLAHLTNRPPGETGERPVSVSDIVTVFEQIRSRLPRWAAAYDQRLPALTLAAAAELVDAGLLRADPAAPSGTDRSWLPTPAVRMWRIKTGTPTGRPSSETGTGPAQSALFEPDPNPGAS